MKSCKILILVFSVLISFQATYADLPENSLYHINNQWQNQNKEWVKLSDFTGKNLLISMIYTHCQHTCPIIVENMRRVDQSIAADKKDDFNFVLVTLTPVTDTPDVLKTFAKERGLDDVRWTMLRGDKSDIHLLAMALETKYKSLGDGEVSHSNLISVLDEQGQILFQAKGAANQAMTLIEKLKGIK